jgi:hypothetical protein
MHRALPLAGQNQLRSSSRHLPQGNDDPAWRRKAPRMSLRSFLSRDAAGGLLTQMFRHRELFTKVRRLGELVTAAPHGACRKIERSKFGLHGIRNTRCPSQVGWGKVSRASDRTGERMKRPDLDKPLTYRSSTG